MKKIFFVLMTFALFCPIAYGMQNEKEIRNKIEKLEKELQETRQKAQRSTGIKYQEYFYDLGQIEQELKELRASLSRD